MGTEEAVFAATAGMVEGLGQAGLKQWTYFPDGVTVHPAMVPCDVLVFVPQPHLRALFPGRVPCNPVTHAMPGGPL